MEQRENGRNLLVGREREGGREGGMEEARATCLISLHNNLVQTFLCSLRS